MCRVKRFVLSIEMDPIECNFLFDKDKDENEDENLKEFMGIRKRDY